MDFLAPKETNSEPQLAGFNLSIPMRYVEYVPLFCTVTETIKYTANNTMHKIEKVLVHLMEKLSETPPRERNQLWEEREAITEKSWNNIPLQAQKKALVHLKFHLENSQESSKGDRWSGEK